jgi:DNA-binding MarR family transcriptional regulator
MYVMTTNGITYKDNRFLEPFLMSSTPSAELLHHARHRGLEEEAYLSLERTTDALRRQVAELLKDAELTPTQYNALRILRGAGEDGHQIGEIGVRLVVHDPDIPRLVDRLEKRGWVTRQRQADDRRCVRVTLTKTGKKLIDGLDAPVQALHAKQLGALGPVHLRQLLRSLAVVREQVADPINRGE